MKKKEQEQEPLVKGGQGKPDLLESEVEVVDFDRFNDAVFKIAVVGSIIILGILVITK